MHYIAKKHRPKTNNPLDVLQDGVWNYFFSYGVSSAIHHIENWFDLMLEIRLAQHLLRGTNVACQKNWQYRPDDLTNLRAGVSSQVGKNVACTSVYFHKNISYSDTNLQVIVNFMSFRVIAVTQRNYNIEPNTDINTITTGCQIKWSFLIFRCVHKISKNDLGFSWHFTFEYCSKICREYSSSINI
jgi:hypothetical protein